MADKYITGVEGDFYSNSVQSNLIGWTMSIDTPQADLSPLGSSGEANYFTGRKNFSGTLDAQYYIDTATTVTDQLELIEKGRGKGGTLTGYQSKFIESSQSMWHGTINISNISKGESREGFQTWSASWVQGSGGPLTRAVTTAT